MEYLSQKLTKNGEKISPREDPPAMNALHESGALK